MKSERAQLDFTEGNIAKKMVLFSWPIFFGNLLQSSYQFIDSLWVGNLLGADALGAVSISSVVIFTVLSFIIGINNATLTVLSQYKGANDEEGLASSLNAFVVVLGLLTILLGLVGFLSSRSILLLLGTPEGFLDQANSYLQINFLGILFLFGYNFIGTVLRAVGDSKSTVRFIFLAVVLNAVLDPLFIAGFNLGIEGAAIATVIAQGTAFLYGLLYAIYKVRIPFRLPSMPQKENFYNVVRLGLPSGLSMIAISGGITAIMSVVASFGEGVVAGFGAAQRIDNLIMLPAVTLGSAVNSMAGQNIGAGKWERVDQIAKNGLYLIGLVSIVISTIVFFGAESLIRLFVNDEATIAFGKEYLKIVAFFYPFLGINFVLNGICRAAGAMFPVLLLNIISFWVLRYPLTYFFASLFDEKGIAIGMGVSFVVSSIIAAGYYKFGKWRDRSVI